MRSLKLIRVLRLVRLLKLARLMKLSQLSESFDLDWINPALMRLIKLFFQIFFLAHLLCCFWYFACTMNEHSPDDWRL